MSAVPEPRTDAPRPDPAAEQHATAERRGRRSLAVALLLGAAGAALALIAGGQTWSQAVTTASQGALPLTAAGRDITGLPAALAVVGLAALVAVFAVRRAGRVFVAGLLALSGAVTVLTSVRGAWDTAALEVKAAKATGLVGAGVEHVTYTAWPWITAVGGVLLLLAGLLALCFGRLWPAMSGRYERAGRPAAARGRGAPDPDRPEELWKALDRGEDPTRPA